MSVMKKLVIVVKWCDFWKVREIPKFLGFEDAVNVLVAEEGLEAPEIVHTQDQVNGLKLHYLLITHGPLGSMDISLEAFSNSRERDAEVWEELFQKADSRFRWLGVSVPPGARVGIIEAEWM